MYKHQSLMLNHIPQNYYETIPLDNNTSLDTKKIMLDKRKNYEEV